MLSLSASVGYAVLGGVASQAVVFVGKLVSWRQHREEERAADAKVLTPLSKYVDPLADLLVAGAMIGLAALVGLLLHTQITGALPAVIGGAAAWDVLLQLFAKSSLVTKTLVRDVSERVTSEVER
jgi:hypothetical protein